MLQVKPLILNIRDALLGVGLLAAGLVLCSLVLSNLYFPLRLFFTGSVQWLTVAKKQQSTTVTRNGPVFYYKIFTEELSYDIKTDRSTYQELEEGTQKKAFVSDRVRSGFFTDREQISLLYCLFMDEEHHFFLTILLFFVILGPLYYIGFGLAKEEFISRYKKIKADKKDASKIVETIAIAKEFLPYLTLVSCIYAFCLLMSKAVLSVEQTGEIPAGITMFLSTLSISLLPGLVLKTKSFFSAKKTVKALSMLVKISLGIWTFYKTIKFLYSADLTAYNNIGDVFTSLLKFIFEI